MMTQQFSAYSIILTVPNENNDLQTLKEMATLLYTQFNAELEFGSDIPGTKTRLCDKYGQKITSG